MGCRIECWLPFVSGRVTNMSPGEIGGWAAFVLSALLGILLYVQSRRIEQVERQLRALTRGAGPGSDRMSLGDLVAGHAGRIETTRNETERLRHEVQALEASIARTVQHVGLVRYNPFNEAGGDQ